MIDRRSILRYFAKNGINSNGCKVINWQHSRGKYFLFIRNRVYIKPQPFYYIIELRGNEIRTFKEYEANIEWSDNPNKIIRKNALLLMPLKNYKLFVAKFKELTPELDWYTKSNSEEQL